MEDELKSKLVEILTSIQTAAGKASDFALSQLPDIAQSYVAYGRVSETAQLVLFLSVFLVGLVVMLCYGILSGKLDKYGMWADSRIAATMVGGGMAFFGFILTGLEMSSFLLVWMSPKVWLLKEIAHLLK